MVGNWNDAAHVLECPSDFDYVGEGMCRQVYKIGNVIYKIPAPFSMDRWANEIEYDNWLRISQMELPEWLALPDCSLYFVDIQPVIAMEYIPGEELPFESEIGHTILEITNLLDTYCANVLVYNGKYYLVDLDS